MKCVEKRVYREKASSICFLFGGNVVIPNRRIRGFVRWIQSSTDPNAEVSNNFDLQTSE